MQNRIPSLLIAIAIATSLFGCASTGQMLSDVRPQSVPSDRALVYVFRNHAEPLIWSASVVMGSRKIASLSQRTFTWFMVQPGKSEIQAVWPSMSGQAPSKIEIDLEAGNIYYIELTGVYRVAGVERLGINLNPVYKFKTGSGMNERAPEVAEALLSTCCTFVSPSPESGR